jgi:hypothetical protein
MTLTINIEWQDQNSKWHHYENKQKQEIAFGCLSVQYFNAEPSEPLNVKLKEEVVEAARSGCVRTGATLAKLGLKLPRR